MDLSAAPLVGLVGILVICYFIISAAINSFRNKR